MSYFAWNPMVVVSKLVRVRIYRPVRPQNVCMPGLLLESAKATR